MVDMRDRNGQWKLNTEVPIERLMRRCVVGICRQSGADFIWSDTFDFPPHWGALGAPRLFLNEAL
jgi:hypothetical protein